MATPEERKTNDLACDEIFKLCANGNEHAEKYLKDIAHVSRVFDDLIDKDYEVKDEQICRAFFELLGGLWLNPFFTQNAGVLLGLHIGSFNSWMDANNWESSEDKTKQLYAHVMKDFINELLGTVAFLTGGYAHMRKCSLKIKETFLEEVK